MPSSKEHAIATLAYAIYDAENTNRLGEQPHEVYLEYAKRAESLLYALLHFQNTANLANLATILTSGEK